MKKVLSILLAVMLCFGLFAACSDKPENNVSPDTPPQGSKDPTTPDDPSDPKDPTDPDDPSNPKDPTDPDDPSDPVKPLEPGLQSDKVTFVGILDMTDDFTLVIEKVNSVGDDRTGIQAEKGTVQVASYNMAGTKRMVVYTLDWASLGLEGAPYEYLGSTVILDVSDENNPKLKETPKKSTYCLTFSDFTIKGTVDEKNVTYTMPDGYVFNLSDLHFGKLRANHLLNEGGKFASGWNDKSVNIPNLFSKDVFGKDYTRDYYFFTAVELYNKYLICQSPDAPVGYTGTISPNQAAATPAQ